MTVILGMARKEWRCQQVVTVDAGEYICRGMDFAECGLLLSGADE